MEAGFRLPRNEPREERGIGIMCIMTLVPEARAGDASFFKNNAITRIKTVSIEPDNKPTDRGAALQNLHATKPEASEARHINVTDSGAMVLKGSFVPNTITAAKRESAKVPKREKPTDIREVFKKSEMSDPEDLIFEGFFL